MAGRVGTPLLLVIVAIALALVALKAIPEGPSFFFQILVYALANGAVYALVALGYTMVYGIIELINFAHGDVFTLGAAFSMPMLGVLGLNEGATFSLAAMGALLLVFVAVMFLNGVVNMAIERVAYRPLRTAPRLAPLITAVGMSFVIEGVLILWIGNSTVHYPDLIPSTPLVPLGDNRYLNLKDALVVVIAFVLMVGLALFVERARLGRAMRATAQDREAAQLMGININGTIAATFFIGAALAGAGGIIFALYFNNINFALGFSAGLFAFTAAVLGGIGNIQGAALGGMIIGFVRAFSDGYFTGAFTDVWIFVILILILTFRPTGLLGMRVPEK